MCHYNISNLTNTVPTTKLIPSVTKTEYYSKTLFRLKRFSIYSFPGAWHILISALVSINYFEILISKEQMALVFGEWMARHQNCLSKNVIMHAHSFCLEMIIIRDDSASPRRPGAAPIASAMTSPGSRRSDNSCLQKGDCCYDTDIRFMQLCDSDKTAWSFVWQKTVV